MIEIVFDDPIKLDIGGLFTGREWLLEPVRIEFEEHLAEVGVGLSEFVQCALPARLRGRGHDREVELIERPRGKALRTTADLAFPKRHVRHQLPDRGYRGVGPGGGDSSL